MADDQPDFAEWGRKVIAGKRGTLAAEAAFNAPPPPEPRQQPADRPRRERPQDDLADSRGLEVEAFIEVGDWVFVLTPSRQRAAEWSETEGHVGITPAEIETISDATGGKPIDAELVTSIAKIKRTFPGARVDAHLVALGVKR